VNRKPLAHVDCTLADKDDTRLLIIVAGTAPEIGIHVAEGEGEDSRSAYNNTTDYLEIERSRGRQGYDPSACNSKPDA